VEPVVSYALYLPTPLIIGAVILDLVWGDPAWLPHPVRLMGHAVTFGERLLRRGCPFRDIVAGVLLVITIVALSGSTTWAMVAMLQAIAPCAGALAATLIASTTLAARGLNDAVQTIEQHLILSDEAAARQAIPALVGRDPEVLDREGLIRAAIESAAENTSDGIIAPLLFMALGGPVAAIIYKAINTLDSMIGYKDARYVSFGRFAARLDDIANFIPARVTAVLIAISAALLTGKGMQSLRTLLIDARKHESPNAGYPEAAMAGALGVELGGEAYYGGELESRPRIGYPQMSLDIAALRAARSLMWAATGLMLATLIIMRALVIWTWSWT
jgi:adenosylcobinamide-phosphate synthase